jgi:hypothetical protein
VEEEEEKEEETGSWRNLHNEEFHDLHFPQNIIKMVI